MINTPVVRIGWPDQFIEHGTIPILRKKHGITADALVEKVLPLRLRFRKRPSYFDGDKPNSVG
jgi:deoxyxylulose-5-phosphate synthase